uniref:Uncharacterized protein n=2 Tax=Rhizochromulina marina TaxID=1034831 RepID=A0A7S2WBH4_9STRA|eukprot:CAMPEP_0118974162 /NCGR_PEP_ID=MMETSP1173-20130426/11105_1 /TAXON_ID=1034831 /ORGANISM="Rhizochromulina marina cf, Strain CCMP1243" /LENGTH=534 /DNA_ID=CAMNT_0006923871 /DNA_START=74 /DNA_END=1678 /DNA_ORIENTATION=-
MEPGGYSEEPGPLDQESVGSGDGEIDTEDTLQMMPAMAAAPGDFKTLTDQLALLPAEVRNKVIQELMEQHGRQRDEEGGEESGEREEGSTREGDGEEEEDGEGEVEDMSDSQRMAAYNQALIYQQQQAQHQHYQQQYMMAQQQYMMAYAAMQQAKQNNAPVEEQQRAQQAMIAAAMAQSTILTQHNHQQAALKQKMDQQADVSGEATEEEEGGGVSEQAIMDMQRQQQMAIQNFLLSQQQRAHAQPQQGTPEFQLQMAQIHTLATHHAQAAAMACARKGGSREEQTRDAHAAYQAVMQAQHHVQAAAAAAAAASSAGRPDEMGRHKRDREGDSYGGAKRVRDASQPMRPSNWTAEEDNKLCSIVDEQGAREWKKISSLMNSKFTDVQCLHRWNKVLKPGLKKGPWTEQEDSVVASLVKTHGVGKIKWSQVAEKLPGRIGKQCRERWFNHLDPHINKTDWSHEENMSLYNNQRTLGNKWSQIAKIMVGRTENGVKNRFNSSAYRKWCSENGLELEGTSRRRSRKQPQPTTPSVAT